jgi:hypothetical protein
MVFWRVICFRFVVELLNRQASEELWRIISNLQQNFEKKKNRPPFWTWSKPVTAQCLAQMYP